MWSVFIYILLCTRTYMVLGADFIVCIHRVFVVEQNSRPSSRYRKRENFFLLVFGLMNNIKHAIARKSLSQKELLPSIVHHQIKHTHYCNSTTWEQIITLIKEIFRIDFYTHPIYLILFLKETFFISSLYSERCGALFCCWWPHISMFFIL